MMELALESRPSGFPAAPADLGSRRGHQSTFPPLPYSTRTFLARVKRLKTCADITEQHEQINQTKSVSRELCEMKENRRKYASTFKTKRRGSSKSSYFFCRKHERAEPQINFSAFWPPAPYKSLFSRNSARCRRSVQYEDSLNPPCCSKQERQFF